MERNSERNGLDFRREEETEKGKFQFPSYRRSLKGNLEKLMKDILCFVLFYADCLFCYVLFFVVVFYFII